MSRLDEIRKRCEAATGGPWIARDNPMRDDGVFVGTGVEPASRHYLNSEDAERHRRIKGPISNGQFSHANGHFIAHARQDIPALLELVEAMEMEVKRFDNTNELIDGKTRSRKDIDWQSLAWAMADRLRAARRRFEAGEE